MKSITSQAVTNRIICLFNSSSDFGIDSNSFKVRMVKEIIDVIFSFPPYYFVCAGVKTFFVWMIVRVLLPKNELVCTSDMYAVFKIIKHSIYE